MSEFYMILTNVGLAKLTNAQITNSRVNLTHLAVGDGNGSYYTPSQTATALKKEVWRGQVASVEADGTNPNWLNIEGIIPATAGGFTIRELGIFDGDGNLFAIGKVPETYKPILSQGSTKDLYLKAILEVANTSNVTMVVDPNVIVASRKYVDDKLQIVSTNLTNFQQQVTEHLDDNLTWQTLTPMNGWAGTIRYAKGAHNNVYLSIGISGGVKTTGTIIAELPTGYRPGFGLEFVATTITSQAAGDNVSIGIFISVNGGIQLDGLAKENVTGYGVFGAVKV